jgi:hypothetical protein
MNDTTATPAADTPAVAEKRRTIGDVACEAILAGKTNQEALDAVKGEFPDGNTSLSSINWYRNKLRKDGQPVKSARELKAEAAPAEPKPKLTAAEKKAAKEAKAAEEAAAAAAAAEADPLG